MQADDVSEASVVHRKSFSRQSSSREWIEANFNAFPKVIPYVAELDGQIAGYILWSQKSGFRPEVVLELEQIAVHPAFRNKGVGKALIEDSLPQVRGQLSLQGSSLKHIIVTTRADNHAQELYRKTLGVEIEAVIKNLYSDDEVFMVSRHLTRHSRNQKSTGTDIINRLYPL
ncbi:MAG: GNAT family N-acetyltransferase [Deltaproteobacteria bacterium]|nr:GNAT family N-acetyltransferase [Deltaproteobacteria bacterium]